MNKQTKQVMKIIDSYRMATTPKNIVSAFRKSGIVTFVDRSKMELRARVDIACATSVRHYAHLERDNEDPIKTVKI